MYLIAGGDSLIGSALSDYWAKENIPFHASTRQEEKVTNDCPLIDLDNPDSFQRLNNYQSAVICAAITDMAVCENNPIKTRMVNVTGTVELIKRLAQNGTHYVFISTNQVFDGQHPIQKPNLKRKPLNKYGFQKAEVEIFIERLENTCILRLTKVISPELPLLKNWLAILSKGEPISAFIDMTLSPISLNQVIKKIDLLVRKRASGIFQLSGRNDISYYEYAKVFAKENGFSSKLVKTDSCKDKLQFIHPKFTSLENI